MSTDTIQEQVFKIISEQLDVGRDEVALDKTFTDDLGADSLGIVELVLAFEDHFEVKIPDDEVDKIKTVGDAVKYITEHCGRSR